MVQKFSENKIALITGAASGIGKVIAMALAKEGAKVVINYHKRKEEAHKLEEAIRTQGGHAKAIQADVSDEAAVQFLFDSIKDVFGSVDILVNNAGINPSKPLEQITLADWQQTVTINLTSAFLVTQAAVPAMIEKGFGRIINISSIAAQTGGVVGPHYAASKAGLIGLTHSYASLLAKHRITANAIAPALIDTEMIKNNPNIKPDYIPLQRFGQPEEVSDVVLLLVNNGYISGQTINVNGGWYMSS
jgi:3-oxoacyl-[acyl-carrier protein] reductase